MSDEAEIHRWFTVERETTVTAINTTGEKLPIDPPFVCAPGVSYVAIVSTEGGLPVARIGLLSDRSEAQ